MHGYIYKCFYSKIKFRLYRSFKVLRQSSDYQVKVEVMGDKMNSSGKIVPSTYHFLSKKFDLNNRRELLKEFHVVSSCTMNRTQPRPIIIVVTM